MDFVSGKIAEFNCKLVVIGDSGVGKTSVMRRFIDNEYSHRFVPTMGMDFKSRMMKINGKYVKVQIWDTAGQERFRSITSAYYREAKGVIIVYDITDRRSFQHVTKWLTNFSRLADDGVVRLLVGNKSDQEERRAVRKIEGEQLADQNGMFFSEVSAKGNLNINQAILQSLQNIISKYTKEKEAKSEKRVTETDGRKQTLILHKYQLNIKAKCCKI